MSRSAANAAIVYLSGNFDTATERLMGRHSASEGFLKGLARHAALDVFYCHTRSADEHEKFKASVQQFRGRPTNTSWIPFLRPAELARPGCLYRPGPNIGHFAWQRRRLDQKAYSLCGVTHTTAEHQVMDALGDLLIAPIQAWDALICTSAAVKQMVVHLLGTHAEYLSERFGARVAPNLQLPVIPLGIDCDSFPSGDHAASARARLRSVHGILDDDVVVLFVGRLNLHEKANPLQMYLCVEAAAKRAGRRIHLVQAGWFAGENNEKAFRQGAEAMAPSVRHLFLDGREPEIRRDVWAMADIFVSLSDNIQETYGLTPVEAMAAGLPQVVSDWNGYRDTIQDGVEGFRVPTTMPPPGHGDDLAFRYATATDGYPGYCGGSSQFISVDGKRCIEAFVELAKRPELRRAMGDAGRRRARELFDWKVVIPQYQELWNELAERRSSGKEIARRRSDQPAHPLRDDPFAIFGGYSTAVIEAESIISLAEDYTFEAFRSRMASLLVRPAAYRVSNENEITRVLAHLKARGPERVADLLILVPQDRRPLLHRTIAWLAKLNALHIAPPGEFAKTDTHDKHSQPATMG